MDVTHSNIVDTSKAVGERFPVFSSHKFVIRKVEEKVLGHYNKVVKFINKHFAVWRHLLLQTTKPLPKNKDTHSWR